MPDEDTWKPLLPSKELNVSRKDEEFRKSLADPLYYMPKEVHIILGIKFFTSIFEYKIGNEIEGTTVVCTPFGNVVMGEVMQCNGYSNDECNGYSNNECNGISNDKLYEKQCDNG